MVTAMAVPELIPLLQHRDTKVAEKAACVVYAMSRKPAERAGLAESQELTPVIGTVQIAVDSEPRSNWNTQYEILNILSGTILYL